MLIRRFAPFALVAGLLLAPATATAAPKPDDLVEKRVRSASPDAKRVRESLVRVFDPLAQGTGAPAACDWIEYLRFRNRGGPRKARRADAVIVMMPGFLGGSASFDQLARNTVRRAASRNRDVEVWGLDRRANCLEDDTGLRAAARAKDAGAAYAYYWGGAEVKGRRFGGFIPPEEASFLGEFGLERTIRDWYTVLRTGVPGQPRRAKKVICGGHSLGGPLTAAFASWDFDGDPQTKSDAGYKQCAGLVGLDTSIALTSGGGAGGGALGAGFDLLLADSGASPYVSAPPLTPETFQIPPIFGIGAFFDPQATDLLSELPHTQNIDLSQRLLFSRDAAAFATDSPSIREFTLTNEATLAGVFDDNSSGISILRSSLGVLTGGPLVDKSFPAPDPTLALPEDPDNPLYAWQVHRGVGADGAEIPLNDAGAPYTSRESEVSDLRQFARSGFEAPANFIEQYFPTRILTDIVAAAGGDRSGGLAALQHDGPTLRPALEIQAGDSGGNGEPDDGAPMKGEPPNELPLSSEIIIPGYNHLDVVTAARRQNDGRAEPTSKALSRFALKAVKAARAKRR